MSTEEKKSAYILDEKTGVYHLDTKALETEVDKSDKVVKAPKAKTTKTAK